MISGRAFGRESFVRGCRALGGAMLAAMAWLAVGALLCPLPDGLRADQGYAPSVRMIARDGSLLREARADGDQARASWVSLDEAGERVQEAMLAAEDRRFYEHLGVDPAAVVRAVVTSLAARRIVSGASTITMQLARLVVPHPRDLHGKLHEMAMAARIEASLSKREILEQYLNRAPFGDLVRGVGAASRYYFDKPPSALSLAEAATLAAIPRGPSFYSLRRHPERVLRRRDRILGRMRDAGMITEEERARAAAEPLTLHMDRGGFGAPHLTAALLAGTLDPAIPPLGDRADLVETTVDRGLQRELERAAFEVLRPLAKRHVTAASVLVVDNATGEILAYVGSPSWSDDARGGKNDGVRARRQPGSTLKPFVYGLAMETLGMTPATALPDLELHLKTPSGVYSPRNYDERFHGPVRLREALGSSLNVPAVWTTSEVGVSRVLERLRELGMTTLTEDATYYGPGLALGAGEVRLYDLVGAYAAIARGGVVRPLRAVRRASLGGREVPIAWPEERRVMPREVAAMIADVLSDPAARTAAFGKHTVLDFPFEVAAKTGTSKGFRDNWTVGFTRDVTVGVWVGNFDGSPMHHVSGITGAGPLFRAAMLAAERVARHGEATEPAPLVDHAGLTRVRACALSGGAPEPGCTHVIEEWVPEGTALEPCTMHEVVAVDTRNGLRATPSCPERVVERRAFERLDGPYAAWAHAAGRAGAPAAFSPLCGADRAGGAGVAAGAAPVAIRYPHDGARFLVDPDRPRAAQAIPLEVDARGAGMVALFVDGRLAGRAAGGAPVYWTLEPGAHTIVAESRGTRSLPVTIRVE